MECAKCGVKVTQLYEYDLCSCCYVELEQEIEEYDMGEILYGEGV